METAPRPIEIFAPFSAALDLTKRILFQPFDLTKWLTIGFAAFLAGLVDGTRANFGFNLPDFSGRAQSHDVALESIRDQIDAWLVGSIIAAVVVVVLAMVILFMWLGSRGRFMFIDCIVRNRGAIEEPWREYRREGNSMFLWSLLVFGISVVIGALLALPFFLPYLTYGEFPELSAGSLIYLIGAAVVFIVAALAVAVVTWFMPPIMYRQRCNAHTAFLIVVRLIAREPGPFILYVLFVLVLVIAGTVMSCIVTCVTCCIAALPYIGTVILLPLYVFYYSYALLFLRQFGPDYDVWGIVAAIEPIAAPLEPPTDQPPASGPPPLPT